MNPKLNKGSKIQDKNNKTLKNRHKVNLSIERKDSNKWMNKFIKKKRSKVNRNKRKEANPDKRERNQENLRKWFTGLNNPRLRDKKTSKKKGKRRNQQRFIRKNNKLKDSNNQSIVERNKDQKEQKMRK